jgi:hypothetical protein
MAVGARSLRGAMGTYAVVGALAVAALALVLWLGGPEPAAAQLTLPAGGPWTGAVLDDGHAQLELQAGQSLKLPPGRYRITLLGAGGASQLRELELPPGPTTLGP